ncbi:hypothetical protein WICPIJ_007521 [Wickerhamomyces pijperi]|uniref:Uncharacterized protein n=1 Tax=Wickerhamomyces pijperi TaxID=599730 RepID=A0A9P8Q1M5_WICPI|nr:hypothetical protein WICPIJ_007521 [Wickerhamomyces pijperi]
MVGLFRFGSVLDFEERSLSNASSALTSIPAEIKASDNLSGSAGAVGLVRPLSSSLSSKALSSRVFESVALVVVVLLA